MVLNKVSDNNLTELKELAFTTLPSRDPTPNPPNIDSGIANSDSSGMYFAPRAPVTNYDATVPTIRVRVANGTFGTLKDGYVPNVPLHRVPREQKASPQLTAPKHQIDACIDIATTCHGRTKGDQHPVTLPQSCSKGTSKGD